MRGLVFFPPENWEDFEVEEDDGFEVEETDEIFDYLSSSEASEEIERHRRFLEDMRRYCCSNPTTESVVFMNEQNKEKLKEKFLSLMKFWEANNLNLTDDLQGRPDNDD